MHNARLAIPPSWSPHRLYQELWKAVDTDNADDALQLVDALVLMLGAGQSLATSAILEMIGLARRRNCQPKIVRALRRLPGYVAPDILSHVI